VIVDSSVLVAIVLRQPGFEPFLERLSAAEEAGIGAPTLAETGLVLTAKLGKDAQHLVAALVCEMGLVVVPFGDEHWRVAVQAYARFGKGRHPAGLNFGDCLTYATTRLSGQPLLCIGADFPKTDLRIA
jgi:ribonuclease VapC